MSEDSARRQDKVNQERFRFEPFWRDGVLVEIGQYAGSEHGDVTTVFTSDRMKTPEVFHADKHCHRLHQGETYTLSDGVERQSIMAHELPKVMKTWLNPIRPCDYCTQHIEKSAEIVQKYAGVPEELLQYYSPGDSRVSEQYSRNDDGEMVLTSRTVTEVYHD